MTPFALASRALSLLALSTLALVACGSDDEGHGNGVNDVRQACAIRAAWLNPRAEKCETCQAAAPRDACGCEAYAGFDGVCAAQGSAHRAEPSCEGVNTCVTGCYDDCDCIEGCYANAQECKRLAAAVDGCVADVCSKYCGE